MLADHITELSSLRRCPWNSEQIWRVRLGPSDHVYVSALALGDTPGSFRITRNSTPCCYPTVYAASFHVAVRALIRTAEKLSSVCSRITELHDLIP